MLLRRARMRKNQVMARGWRIGFLSVCVLLLVAVASCDDAKTCKASTECSAGEMCATAGNAAGPYYCLKNCDPSGECALGYECAYVTNADCPTCDVITRACVLRAPR